MKVPPKMAADAPEAFWALESALLAKTPPITAKMPKRMAKGIPMIKPSTSLATSRIQNPAYVGWVAYTGGAVYDTGASGGGGGGGFCMPGPPGNGAGSRESLSAVS